MRDPAAYLAAVRITNSVGYVRSFEVKKTFGDSQFAMLFGQDFP